MAPRGLILALLIGLVAGPVFGIILYQTDTHEQLVFVDGSSISILTEKIEFELGEKISIKIINSLNLHKAPFVPVSFSNSFEILNNNVYK